MIRLCNPTATTFSTPATPIYYRSHPGPKRSQLASTLQGSCSYPSLPPVLDGQQGSGDIMPLPSDPAIIIDHAYFPHIFDAIVKSASFETLLVLRASCSTLRDRIDRELSHIVIAHGGAATNSNDGREAEGDTDANSPTPTSVQAATTSGYILWSIPLCDSTSAKGESRRCAALACAKRDFTLYARLLAARTVSPTIDLHGEPDRGLGIVSAIFHAPLFSGGRSLNLAPTPRVRFRIFPDAQGHSRLHGYDWPGARLLMDTCRARRVHMATGVHAHNNYVFVVNGSECACFTTAYPPPGSTVVYDFSAWKRASAGADTAKTACRAACTATNSSLVDPGAEPPSAPAVLRMASFISHMVHMLSTECTVYIFGLQRVDTQWLAPRSDADALAAGGRTAAGSRPTVSASRALPIATYVRDAIIRGAHAKGCADIVPDLDHFLNIMPPRCAWQTTCNF